MPPASAPRAGVTPEASRDRSSGTLGEEISSLVIGIIVGAVLGLAVSFTFLYSLWLPITAVSLLVSAVICKGAWRTPVTPSFVAAGVALAVYLGVFWLPPELASRRASTPREHALAARALHGRAQIFGDEERAWRHLVLAAEGDDVLSLRSVGEAYLYGHYHLRRDPTKARRWLERAAELGSEEASRELSSEYHYPKPRS